MKSLATFINEQLENSNQNPIQENTKSTEHIVENNDNQEAVQEGENTENNDKK